MRNFAGNKKISDDFEKISAAIHYLVENQLDRPKLNDVANSIGLSTYYFQRMFTRWVGVSPKKFLKHLTLTNARDRLNASLGIMDTASEVGLSNPNRLHDLFITTIAVTPGEYKTHGAGLTFIYGFHPSLFGEVIVVINDRGLCGLGFTAEIGRDAALAEQQTGWDRGKWYHDHSATLRVAKSFFTKRNNPKAPLSVLLRGTPFQTTVWDALLKIPSGTVISYAELAARISKPNAARSVGTACAANRLGIVIPCHRIIRGSGVIDGYRWGTTRKRAMLAYESVKATIT